MFPRKNLPLLQTAILLTIVILAAVAGRSISATEAPAQKGLEFFEQKIRPVLVAECYECHAGKKHKGGLALDSRAGLLKGGDTGPGVTEVRHARPSMSIASWWVAC